METQTNLETSSKEIFKETTFNEIILMTQRLAFFYGDEKSLKGRVGFISAIMRDLNVYNLNVVQKFSGTSSSCDSETFSCSIKIEHKNSDNKFLKEDLEKKLLEIRNQVDLFQKNNSDFDLKTILSQEKEVNELYHQLYKIFNHKDAAINITALLVLEFELMSSKKNKSCLYHGELYDLKNPLDMWHTVVEINAIYEPRLLLNYSSMIH